MKYLKNIVKNHCSIKYIYIIIIFFNFIYFSLNSISIGKYPYIKRLINGNYIILSNTKIAFTDSTLQTEINSIALDNIYGDKTDNIGSTTVSQFKENDGGYIIAILNQTLFIFSKTGIHQANTTISFINPINTCSVIPKNQLENNFYYFTIIYTYCESTGENDCKNIKFKQGKFDANLKTINFNESQSKSFTPDSYHITSEKFFGTISCNIMKNNSEEYIVCLYGNENNFIISIFDPLNYEEVSYKKYNGFGGQYFKSLILPNEYQLLLFCSHKAKA